MTDAEATALAVAAIAAASVVGSWISARSRRDRLELLHRERLAAMDKGIPLPELPVEPPSYPTGERHPPNPNAALLTGIILLFAGVGAMAGLLLTLSARLRSVWSLPLPVALVGLGLILYHLLSRRRAD